MSARESLEVELKFDVDAGQPAPDLSGLAPGGAGAPTVYELNATYLDTAGHDLAARRITLRRRTGGTDAGWHLKRPTTHSDARRELAIDFTEAPADGGVPEPIRDAIAAIVRDQPLIPVAEIITERTVTLVHGADGAVLAEFAEDRVLAHAHQSQHTQEWAEWEFELVDGDAELLAAARKLLRAAGARKAASVSKLARAIGSEPRTHTPTRLRKKPTALNLMVHSLATHRDSLVAWDPLVRENAFDAVHQMRVTARKLRSILTSFPQILDPAGIAGLSDELRELGEVLGEARDREVQLEINRELLAQESDVPADLRTALIDDEIASQERALRTLRFALSTPRYLSLLNTLDRVIADPVPGPDADRAAAKVAVAGTEHARKRLRKAEKRLTALEPWSAEWVAQVHRVRKRAKAVRYTADAAKPLDLKTATTTAKHAARIQTHLGHFQDTVVNREQLTRVAAEPGLSARAIFVLGRLDAREETRGRAAVQAYLDEN